MRNKKVIEEEMFELKIEKAFVTIMEKDGEMQVRELKQYDKYKSNNNKIIAKLQRRENFNEFLRNIKKVTPKACAVILAVLVLSLSLLVTNETAMASVIKILAQKYDIHMEVTLPENPELIDNFLEDGYNITTYLPEGYAMTYAEIRNTSVRIECYNDDYKSIKIEQSILDVNKNFDVETSGEEEYLFINDNEFLYYYNMEKGWSRMIGNYNGVNVNLFCEFIDRDELIEVVSGLKLNNVE